MLQEFCIVVFLRVGWCVVIILIIDSLLIPLELVAELLFAASAKVITLIVQQNCVAKIYFLPNVLLTVHHSISV
jgi:hypothetical protein